MAAMAMALPLSQPPPHSCSSNATATATGAGGSRSCALVASSIVRIIGKPKMTRNDEHVRYGAARHRNGTIMCTRTASATNEVELQRVKNNLLQLVSNTSRGVNTSSDQRALVEEVMISLETSNAGVHLDLSLLHGTWLLQYTTASDVLSILRTSELPFLQVGQIFQKFDCLGGTDNGTVFNVVRWSLSNVLQDTNGATLAVTADFSLVSSRTIQLRFKEANVGEVLIGEAVQALVAPAILPRTFLNLQVLQFLRSLNIHIPLGTQDVSRVRQSVHRASVGLLYYLTYLDKDMLLGRALGNGGEFIFSRTQPLQPSRLA